MARIGFSLLVFTLIFPFSNLYSQNPGQSLQFYDSSWFNDGRVSPYPLIAGKSTGMGNLSFTLKDPIRDVFVNPAKYYQGTGSKFLTSPSFTAKSLSVVQERRVTGRDQFSEIQELFSINNRSEFQTSILPVGGFFEIGSFYAGGSVAFIDHSSSLRIRERSEMFEPDEIFINNKSEANITGTPVHLIAGYHISDELTLALSHRRISLNQDREELNFRNQMSFDSAYQYKSQFTSAGLGFSLFGGESYLLGGFYSNRTESDPPDSEGTYWEETDGFTFEFDHMQPFTSTFSAGVFAAYNRRDFNDRTADQNYDRYTEKFSSLELGAGINKTFYSTMLAAELLYHKANYTLKRDQSSTEIGFANTLRNRSYLDYLQLRAGADVPLVENLKLQVGIQLTSLVQKNRGEEQTDIPENQVDLNASVKNDPQLMQIYSRFTAGVNYSFTSFDLIYSLNIEQAPEQIVIISGQQDPMLSTLFQNQLTVSYNF